MPKIKSLFYWDKKATKWEIAASDTMDKYGLTQITDEST